VLTPSLGYAAASSVPTLKEHGTPLIDIADKPDNTFKMLSPYYPHGNISCPGWSAAATIEGIWQACKSIGERSPGFTNDAFLNMAPPSFRELAEGERLFGWRYGIEGRIIPRARANRVLFTRPYLETVNSRCTAEINALYELIACTTDRIYVYDSSFVTRNDGHDDPAFVFTAWFSDPVRPSH
jgi:hypothetical protein